MKIILSQTPYDKWTICFVDGYKIRNNITLAQALEYNDDDFLDYAIYDDMPDVVKDPSYIFVENKLSKYEKMICILTAGYRLNLMSKNVTQKMIDKKSYDREYFLRHNMFYPTNAFSAKDIHIKRIKILRNYALDKAKNLYTI